MNKIFCCLCTLLLAGCSVNDEKNIIGRWQSDDEWYEYTDAHTYSAGRGPLTMVSNFKFSMDAGTGKLTMYTDDAKQTYYLLYRFSGNDTLWLNNALNSKPHEVKFFRVKNKQDK